MSKKLFPVLLLIFSTASFSQSKEYIVLSNGDTLFGEVRLPIAFGKPKFRDFVMFKENGKEEKKYLPKEIREYKESGIEYFSFNNQIMKTILSGPVYLLDCMIFDPVGTTSISVVTVATAGVATRKNTVGVALYKKGEEPIYVKKNKFSKIVSKYLGDYPNIEADIKNKKYKYKNIETLIADYNKWKSNQIK